MALFQKKPSVQSSAPLYTLGAEKSYLIIGLGNPGEEYKSTRHNAGFMAVDVFAEKNGFPGWTLKKEMKAAISVSKVGPSRVILCKPQTFMNSSGQAAQAVQRFFRINNLQTLAVYDELAIPLGVIRTRIGGSDGGHNGVKSLIGHLGENFCRLRIGIGSAASHKADAADFVLGRFASQELADMRLLIQEASAMVGEFVTSGEINAETRKII